MLTGMLLVAVGSHLAGQLNGSQPIAIQDATTNRNGQTVPDGHVDRYGDPLPEGALARLGTTRYRQGTGAGEAVFLDDGRTIIVGCENQGARLIDVTTGKTTGTIDFREFPVRRVIGSGDGARLAFVGTQTISGTDLAVHRVVVWDRAADRVISRVQWNSQEGGELRTGCFSPEGNVAMLGLSDGSVRLIDAETGLTLKSRQLFMGDDYYLLAGVTFSPNGERLVAVGEEGGLIWDWLRDDEPRSLPGMVGRARNTAFSPDGRRLAVGLEAHGTGSVCVRIYDAQSLAPVSEIRNEREQHFSGVIAYTHDGTRIALGVYQPDAIELHDAGTGALVQRLPLAINSPRSIFVSPDDHWIGCTTGYPALPIWDLRTGQPVAADSAGHEGVPSLIEFTPDGQSVVTAGDDPVAIVWDAANGALQHRLTHGPGKWIRGMTVSPDGEWVATSSLDETVRIWNRRTGDLKFTLFGHGALGGTRALRFTPDGSRLLSWGDDLFLRMFDVRTGKALTEDALRPEGVIVHVNDDGGVERGPASPFLQFDGAAFTHDGTRLLLSMRKTFVFDVESGREERQVPLQGLLDGLAVAPDDSCFALAVRGPNREIPLPGGRVQVATSRAQTLKMFSPATGQFTQEWALAEGYTSRIAFSADGRRVAVAIQDTTWSVHIYNAVDGTHLAVIETGDQEIRGLAFSPDGGGLATALSDTTVLIWDVAHFEGAGQ